MKCKTRGCDRPQAWTASDGAKLCDTCHVEHERQIAEDRYEVWAEAADERRADREREYQERGW